MSKSLVHYFSGTGNSLLAAKQLGAELEKHNIDTVYHALEKGLQPRSAGFNLHIFFFPVYALSTPHIVQAYLKNLPGGTGKKAAVISTNGWISTRFRDGYQGWALHQARLYLRLKGYDVFFSDTLDYPHNLTPLMPPRNKNSNMEIINQSSERIPGIAAKIARRERWHRPFFWPNLIWCFPFGALFSLIARRLAGKLFDVSVACDSCGLCVSKCPVGAIKLLNGRLRWGWNCESCLRCINICPQKAIQLSSVRVVAFKIATLAVTFCLAKWLIPATFLSETGKAGRVTICAVCSVVFLILLDFLLYKISHFFIFRKIVGWGFSNFYGRYHAGQFEEHVLGRDD